MDTPWEETEALHYTLGGKGPTAYHGTDGESQSLLSDSESTEETSGEIREGKPSGTIRTRTIILVFCIIIFSFIFWRRHTLHPPTDLTGSTLDYYKHNMHINPQELQSSVNSMMEAILRNSEPIDSKKLYHLHIPKSSGASLNEDLTSQNLTVWSSETQWGNWDHPTSDLHIITIVREPRYHIASMFNHCKTSHASSLWNHRCRRQSLGDVPFGHWIHYFWYFKERYEGNIELDMFKEFEHKKHRLDKRSISRKDDRSKFQPFHCYTPINLQSNRMGIVGLDKKKINKRLFDDFFHIGLQEFYDESFCVLMVKITKQIPDDCICSKVKGSKSWNSHGVKSYNAESMLSTVEADELEVITNLDRIIHHLSLARLKVEIDYIRENLEPTFLCGSIDDIGNS